MNQNNLEKYKKQIRFEIRKLGNPYSVNPKRNLYTSIPMDVDVFKQLFPNYSTKANKDCERPLKFKSHKKQYYIDFENPTKLEEILGEKWYITHTGSQLGLFMGKVSFTLVEEYITDFQYRLDNSNVVLEDSIVEESMTYLHIGILYTNFSKYDPRLTEEKQVEDPDEYWKKRAEQLVRSTQNRILRTKKRKRVRKVLPSAKKQRIE